MASNIVIDSIEKFSCAPQCTPGADDKCTNCGKRAKPHVACNEGPLHSGRTF